MPHIITALLASSMVFSPCVNAQSPLTRLRRECRLLALAVPPTSPAKGVLAGDGEEDGMRGTGWAAGSDVETGVTCWTSRGRCMINGGRCQDRRSGDW